MDLTAPFSAVCPTLDGPVLTVLAGTTRALSGREVARLCRRGSWAGIRRTLQRLVEQGIVTGEEVGNAVLYSLNRRHVAAPAVELLAGLREEMIRRLGEALAEWDVRPLFATLYGSAARGDGDTSSDVDLFLVRPASVAADDRVWWGQREALARSVRVWTGNSASIAEIGEEEISNPALRDSLAHYVDSIRTDGITLAGRLPPDLEAL